MEKNESNQPAKVGIWNDPDKRAIVYQVLFLGFVLGLSYFLFYNTQANLEKREISTGFGFLDKEASFDVGESLIEYSASDTYFKVFIVGALNTLKVSFVGIILAIFIGTVMGISRLSSNWIVKKFAGFYVEGIRNVPLLLQLFFWYSLFTEILPHPRKALNPMSGIYLSNRGFYYGIPADHPIYFWMFISILVAFVAIWGLRKWAHKRQDLTGEMFPLFYTSLGILILLPLITWLLGGAPTEMNVPTASRFNIKGGATVTPEFAALLFGLVLYTGAFIAEIVRSGIQSISHGQTEAAISLGLKQVYVLNLVVLPQSLRVIIPPLTNQVLNLTKNSSLAIAIGYPDFVAVLNTTMNQTGQAMEAIGSIMLLYLFFSLSTSLFMNWYNKKIALVER